MALYCIWFTSAILYLIRNSNFNREFSSSILLKILQLNRAHVYGEIVIERIVTFLETLAVIRDCQIRLMYVMFILQLKREALN